MITIKPFNVVHKIKELEIPYTVYNYKFRPNDLIIIVNKLKHIFFVEIKKNQTFK